MSVIDLFQRVTHLKPLASDLLNSSIQLLKIN